MDSSWLAGRFFSAVVAGERGGGGGWVAASTNVSKKPKTNGNIILMASHYILQGGNNDYCSPHTPTHKYKHRRHENGDGAKKYAILIKWNTKKCRSLAPPSQKNDQKYSNGLKNNRTTEYTKIVANR